MLYKDLLEIGFRLINSQGEHALASELEHWYPLLDGKTPKSKVFDEFPSLEEVKHQFEFPISIKGNRQTSKHNPALSIVNAEQEFAELKRKYTNDSILYWHKVVVREFVHLKPLNFQ